MVMTEPAESVFTVSHSSLFDLIRRPAEPFVEAGKAGFFVTESHNFSVLQAGPLSTTARGTLVGVRSTVKKPDPISLL
jgi:hypothetical protein